MRWKNLVLTVLHLGPKALLEITITLTLSHAMILNSTWSFNFHTITSQLHKPKFAQVTGRSHSTWKNLWDFLTPPSLSVDSLSIESYVLV